MKITLFLLIATIAISIVACKKKETPKEKAYKLFNEGVAFNIQSIEEQNNGNYDRAAQLNKESLAKFMETYKADSSHDAVRTAIGHSLYIDRQFKEAIKWLEEDIKLHPDAAISYRELGLCRINSGQPLEGKTDIDKAFTIDTSVTIRDMTIQDLEDISDLAYSFGDTYISQGEEKTGKEYHQFSAMVLMMALDYRRSDTRLEKKVLEVATKAGNKDVLDYLKKTDK